MRGFCIPVCLACSSNHQFSELISHAFCVSQTNRFWFDFKKMLMFRGMPSFFRTNHFSKKEKHTRRSAFSYSRILDASIILLNVSACCIIERSPCEMPILDNSGISCFWKRGGYPLSVSSEVLDTLDFDADATRETLTPNDHFCRRVLEQKRWFEPTPIIVFRVCVTWRSTVHFGCIKKAWQLIFRLVTNPDITDLHCKSLNCGISFGK